MLEQDIIALSEREPLPLERLEKDIWDREKLIATMRRFLTSGQAVIIGAAILVSAVVGILVAAQLATPSLTTEEKLAPSYLLLGTKP